MRRLKARFHVTGPFQEEVTYKKCWMDKELKSLQSEEVTEMKETFHVRFPQGHSIRVVGRDRLVALGLNIRPRVVDMDTGDVVDIGGNPFDFDDPKGDPLRDAAVDVVEGPDDDLDTLGASPRSRKKSNATL